MRILTRAANDTFEDDTGFNKETGNGINNNQ